mmetsp:Transcript_1207/g.1696  ORF Transcript_1207/g.1696 Transcript_1207/m.1696 type:complete len:576 (-) Transcript_1207:72-1799(-)|eukprot:CAMPEP_0184863908 /NCGR_PEP_ID=MMETSP0580-20130426/13013_1 /TAXON_ID=1118495 /ORGANISM="Dactyliosolen fragilissimus" /LENGTH=575 /DNA_ID=CAMNT_0027362497 /DNA_START=10 /DNA_END=1737 /DNA_ORIENTATION=-
MTMQEEEDEEQRERIVDDYQMERLRSKLIDEGLCLTVKSVSMECGIGRGDACKVLESLPYYNQNQKDNLKNEKANAEESLGEDMIMDTNESGTTSTDDQYEVTRYVSKTVGDKTVIGFCKERIYVNANGNLKGNKKTKNPIFALSYVDVNGIGPSTAKTGHYFDMETIRNALQTKLNANVTNHKNSQQSLGNNDFHDHEPPLNVLLDPHLASSRVKPIIAMKRTNADHIRKQRVASTFDDSNSNLKGNDPNHNSNQNQNKIKTIMTKTRKPNAPMGRKMTTAANFFNTNSSSNSKTTNGKSLDQPIATTTNTKTNTTTKTTTNTNTKTNTNTNRKQKITKKEIKSDNNPNKRVQSDDTNPISSTSTTQHGNADDFVGDQDEDEEFLRQDKERKKRNATEERKKIRRQAVAQKKDIINQRSLNPVRMDTSNANEDKDRGDDKLEMSQPTTGTMDAFTSSTKTKHPPNNNNDNENDKNQSSSTTTTASGKKRKQVLEERTFVDENGYFKTETVTVYKEIDESNDKDNSHSHTTGNNAGKNGDIPNTSKTSTKSFKQSKKNTSNMKQGSLMGFFAKKK